MSIHTLEQWFITGVFEFSLVGYENGVKTITSPVCDVEGDVFTTTDGNQYVLGTVDSVFELTCSNAKQRLQETIIGLKEIVY